MSSEEGSVRLKTLLLREARCAEPVVDYMINIMKMDAIADFASFFSETDYLAGVVAEILDKTSCKGDPLQRSRLRTAWELCRAELKQALTKKSTGDPSDSNWDSPLDPDLQRNREATFTKLHNLRFEPHVCPSDALFGRLYREFKRRCLTVLELGKVRSAAQHQAVMGSSKTRRIMEGVSLTLDGEQDTADLSFATPLQVIWALQILTHGWIMTGTSQRDSVAKPGTTVVDASATECFAYLHFVIEQIMRHPGPPAQTTAWALERDRQTRAKARALFLDNWPWGEALRESRERHLAVLWTCGHSSLRAEPIPVLQQHAPVLLSPAKTAQSAAPPPTAASECCPKFNSAAGCTSRQKFCPLKLVHKCSAMLPGGRLCGAWQHGKHRCSATGTAHLQPRKDSGNQQRSAKRRSH